MSTSVLRFPFLAHHVNRVKRCSLVGLGPSLRKVCEIPWVWALGDPGAPVGAGLCRYSPVHRPEPLQGQVTAQWTWCGLLQPGQQWRLLWCPGPGQKLCSGGGWPAATLWPDIADRLIASPGMTPAPPAPPVPCRPSRWHPRLFLFLHCVSRLPVTGTLVRALAQVIQDDLA